MSSRRSAYRKPQRDKQSPKTISRWTLSRYFRHFLIGLPHAGCVRVAKLPRVAGKSPVLIRDPLQEAVTRCEGEQIVKENRFSDSQKFCGVSRCQIGFSFHRHTECKQVGLQADCQDLYVAEKLDIWKEAVKPKHQEW
jgi:hypothetical protein